MYIQSERQIIVDYIFPIVTGTIENNNFKISKFLGTGFLIGNRGYALTCLHVIENIKDVLGTLFFESGKWAFLPIDKSEYHLTEDVALIHIVNNGYVWKTPFSISNEKEFGWLDYLMGGYPSDTVWERLIYSEKGLNNLFRPDLISIKGYIRRDYVGDLEIKGIKGNSFYELSTIAGKGCSGSPVFKFSNNKIWSVIGIYSAEKIIYKGEFEDKYVSTAVSYAVRSTSFAEWKPTILEGISILDESQNYFI